MKVFNAVLSLIAFSTISAQAAELVVSQGYTTKYYAEFLAPIHANVAFGFMDDELRNYDCLQGKSTGDITKKARNPLFGSATPGDYELTYKTKCFNADLKAVRFTISSIGYDEDYTQFIIELSTKSKGTLQREVCIYGGEARLVKCPAGMFEKPTSWSKSVQ